MLFNRRTKLRILSWFDKGLIDESQKQILLKDLESTSISSSFFLKALALIGSLFLAMGIVMLTYKYWDDLSRTIQNLIIFMMPTIPFLIGYVLSYVLKDTKKVGYSFIFLANLLLIAAFYLLLQIYEVDISDTNLFLVFFLLSLPSTLCFRFRSLVFLSTILFYLASFVFFGEREVEPREILIIFTILSGTVFLLSLLFDKVTKTIPHVFQILEFISLQILFASLWIAITSPDFYFLGKSFYSTLFQNMQFLIICIAVMWSFNKISNKFLRNSTFFWLTLFFLHHVTSLFYQDIDLEIFFLSIGIILILAVLLYLKRQQISEKIFKKRVSERDSHEKTSEIQEETKPK